MNNRRIYRNIFQYQNIFLKTLVVLIGSIATIFLKWQYLPLIFIITILWLSLDSDFINRYLKALIVILPFFISYMILGLLFDIALQEQLIFLGRITLLLLFSVYLLKTTLLERLSEETTWLRKWKLINQIFLFIIATGFFVKIFYKEIRGCKTKIKKIDDVIKVIIDSFNNVCSQIELIEMKTNQLLSSNKSLEGGFFNWANVYLTCLLTAYIMILAL